MEERLALEKVSPERLHFHKKNDTPFDMEKQN